MERSIAEILSESKTRLHVKKIATHLTNKYSSDLFQEPKLEYSKVLEKVNRILSSDIKGKIQKYLDYKKVNTNQLEVSIGVSKSYWRKTRSISATTFADICRIYTDLNTEWLLRGEGDMLKSGVPIITTESLNEEIISLRSENAVLREMVGLKKKDDSLDTKSA